MSNLQALLNLGEISQFDVAMYEQYSTASGRKHLKSMLFLYHMEEVPPHVGENVYSWLEGRRSSWRDAQHSVDRVDTLLREGVNNDRISE